MEDFEKLNSDAPEGPDPATVQGRETKNQIRYTGFVAQEVGQAAQSIGYDFCGVDKPQNEEGLYGFRYSELVVPLVKAVQEQQSLLRDLGAEIEKSKIHVSKLEIGKLEMEEQLKAESSAQKAQLDKITAAMQGAGISLEN